MAMHFKTLVAAFAFAVTALAGTTASAQDARAELAREAMQLMQVERILGEFFSQMSPMVATGMARDLNLGPTEEARMAELVAEEFRLASPAMVEEMGRVYAERMTEQELRETVTFLRTPSGAAFLRTQFDAQGELQRIGAMAGMRVGLQAMQRLEAERAAARNEGKT
jgi:hypothetical protein